MSEQVTMKQARHFLRCPDCLGVWAVELQIPTREGIAANGPWARHAAEQEAFKGALTGGCPYNCGTDLVPEHMGQLFGDHLSRLDGAEAACDSSCTHARGPKCECPCGGTNHGVGILADIEVRSDQGKASARFRAAPKSAGQAVARRAEWLALLAEVEAAVAPLKLRRDALLNRKHAGAWLSSEEFSALCDLKRDLARACAIADLKTHSGRVKAARTLLSEWSEVTQ